MHTDVSSWSQWDARLIQLVNVGAKLGDSVDEIMENTLRVVGVSNSVKVTWRTETYWLN